MGYIALDTIVRSAIASKGHSTLHLYVPFLHWAFEGIKKYQETGTFTEIKSTKEPLSEEKTVPIPSDMLMWNKIGIVVNGKVQTFVNKDNLSLQPSDFNTSDKNTPVGLYAYNYGRYNDLLYTTNIYVSTENGVVAVGLGNSNSFKVNWRDKVIQLDRSLGQDAEVYIEYVANAHDPTTQTLINELAKEFIMEYIFYREARFRFGSSHRETRAAELDWLNAEDDLAAATSDLTASGFYRAINDNTRRTIDQ